MVTEEPKIVIPQVGPDRVANLVGHALIAVPLAMVPGDLFELGKHAERAQHVRAVVAEEDFRAAPAEGIHAFAAGQTARIGDRNIVVRPEEPGGFVLIGKLRLQRFDLRTVHILCGQQFLAPLDK